MNPFGFLRVAAAVPPVRVADCAFNVEHILSLMRRAEGEGVNVLVFPELALTGYTCADLFHQPVLQRGAVEALGRLVAESVAIYSGLAVVGLPLVVDDRVFNCAAVLHRGELLGIVPKSYLPNYKEFYEARWFSPAIRARSSEVILFGRKVPFGTSHLFAADDVEGLIVGVEICEDLWVPASPSSAQALAGATLLVNLSASNEIIGKANYRRQLVLSQSARCMAAYVYTSCGVGESTTDVVFGGHCLVAEDGTIVAESPRFRTGSELLVTDIDLDRLRHDRVQTNSFNDCRRGTPAFRRVPFELEVSPRSPELLRDVEAHPFVPNDPATRKDRCDEIFHTQVAGLAKRLGH